MSIIKRISVYDGNRWNSFPIGAEATNISYNDNGTIKSLNTVINDLNNSVSGYDSELTRLEEKIDSKVSGTFVTIPQAGSASGAQNAYAETRPDLETPQYWRMNINSKDTSGNDVRRLLYATDNGIGLWDGVNDQQVWSLSSTLNTSIDTINNNLNNTIKNVAKNGNNFVFTRTSGDTFSVADNNTIYTGSSPIAVSSSTNVISHANSGVTAGTKGTTSTAQISLANGGSFSVPGFAVNATGHITTANAHTVKLPTFSNATTAAAGLMSAADKKKLNNLKLATTIINAQRASSITLGANAGTSGSFSYSAPSGYIFIGMSSYNTGDPMVHFATLNATSGKIQYYVKNQHTSMTKPCRPSVGCVFMKLSS